MEIFLFGGRAFYAAVPCAEVGALIQGSTKNLPRKSGASSGSNKAFSDGQFLEQRVAPSQ